MRTGTVLTGLIVLLVGLGSAGVLGAQAPAKTNDESVGHSSNAFGVNLYAKLAAKEGNIVFSPSSIHTALAMTYAGACGDTAKQMADVLHYGQGEAFFQSYGAYLKACQSGPTAQYQLYVANALWPQEGYRFLPTFLDINKNYFNAAFFPVDYEKHFEATRQKINAWVEKKTKDCIKDLLPEKSLDPLTRLVLTNAIYFKGDWRSPFKKRSTRDTPFFLLDGKNKSVPMMHQAGYFAYGQTDDLQLLKMPYKGDELSMIVLLPKEKLGLSKIEKKLTPKTLATWLQTIGERQKVQLSLPKFRVDCRPELKKTLQAMGMTDAFSGKADFSGMTGVKDLFISNIFHKAFIQVDEKGTEAAAATAVVMKRNNGGGRRGIDFVADHPFLFLVRHEKTGAILFLGRVVEP